MYYSSNKIHMTITVIAEPPKEFGSDKIKKGDYSLVHTRLESACTEVSSIIQKASERMTSEKIRIRIIIEEVQEVL